VSQYEYAVQFSGSTVGFEAHVGRGVHSLKLIYNIHAVFLTETFPFSALTLLVGQRLLGGGEDASLPFMSARHRQCP